MALEGTSRFTGESYERLCTGHGEVLRESGASDDGDL